MPKMELAKGGGRAREERDIHTCWESCELRKARARVFAKTNDLEQKLVLQQSEWRVQLARRVCMCAVVCVCAIKCRY